MNDFARPGLGQTELPPVNSDDNGKVLGVNNGAWDKVDAPSGGDDSNIEYVRFSHQSSSPAWVCDHTVAEMEAAYQSGKTIVGIKEQTAYDSSSWSLSTGQRGSATYFEFCGFCHLVAPGGVYFLYVNRIAVSNDTITVLSKSVELS